MYIKIEVKNFNVFLSEYIVHLLEKIKNTLIISRCAVAASVV
jgi:hypothetical protein